MKGFLIRSKLQRFDTDGLDQVLSPELFARRRNFQVVGLFLTTANSKS